MLKFETPRGATPLDDVEGLLLPDVKSLADLSATESEAILGATTKRLKRRNNPKRRWLTDALLRAVHEEMFAGVWDWAGKHRKKDLTIGIAHHLVREEIGKLCDDVWAWDRQKENPLPVLERAARLHHRLAWIHPFRNGNGRHARLIADMYLRSHDHPLPVWPSGDISRKGGARDRYLAALRAADRGNFKPLIDYTAEHLPK
ncbi:MAG: mobile mystery protein B [Elusimicrobia bacterium]|nr:mobile mystery protein B [Elusimicrobiota bacterium]